MKPLVKKLVVVTTAFAFITGVTACRSKAEAAVAVPVVIGLVAVAAVGGLIIGSRMAHSQGGYVPMKYRDDTEVGYRSGAAMNRCAAKYKSFNAKTGMVTVNGGIMKPCPYLSQ